MIKRYYDEVRAKVLNVLTNLQFGGVDVLTSTKTDGRSLPIKNVADPVDDQDAVTKKYLQDNGSGGVASVNGEAPGVAGDVVVSLDSVAKKGGTSSVAMSVPQDAYAAGWAASPQVPTKADLYTKIETLASKAYVDDRISSNVVITLSATGTVQDRINGAVEGEDYPTGWVLAADGKNLDITHNLGSPLLNVTVVNFPDATTRQLRVGSAAYTGWYDYAGDSIKIQSLATVNSKIAIYLQFV